MRLHGVLGWCFATALCLLGGACATEHNTIRLNPADKGKTPYRQLSTEHYLYVDENHVAEAERGERRVQLVLRSSGSDKIKLFIRLRLYPEDDFSQPALELRAKEAALRPVVQFIRREALAEQVTILESGDSLRTNPMIGNDVQAQSGYITFGKPTGAGAARREWQIVLLEAELATQSMLALFEDDAITLQVSGDKARGIADFSRRQRTAWRRFGEGRIDQTVGE